MGYICTNPNPSKKSVGDCVIRAISITMGIDWLTAYLALCIQGLKMCDMPSANAVWGEFLHQNGFKRYLIPEYCPVDYTVRQFCEDEICNNCILATGTHVIAVKNSNYLDSWDSGDEIPIYFWTKKEK